MTHQQATVLKAPAEAHGMEELRLDLIADTREVFDASGSETPQSVRDVIEYVDSWLQVQVGRAADRSKAQPQPTDSAPELIDRIVECLNTTPHDATTEQVLLDARAVLANVQPKGTEEAAEDLRVALAQRDIAIEGRDREAAKAKAMRAALDFAAGAIGDAIYTEDGLDGDAGQRVLHIITEARELGTFDQQQFGALDHLCPFDRADKAEAALAATQAPAPAHAGCAPHTTSGYCIKCERWISYREVAPSPAVAHPPLPKGWTFNHARQQTDEDGPVAGTWELGWLDDDGIFHQILVLDTWLYDQEEAAEPLAMAILARLSDVPVQGSQS